MPQNEMGRAEAMCIANTSSQYCALNGLPLRGLIQDFIVGAVRMCSKDTFYDRQHYQQLVYHALPEFLDGQPILTVPPAVVKPARLWTGKQVGG